MQGREVLEISGTLRLDEFVRFQYFNTFRRTWWIWAFVALAALPSLLIVGILALIDPTKLTLSGWIAPLLLLLFWGAVVTAPYRGAKRQMQTNAVRSGPATYAFGPDGVSYRGSLSSSEVAYPAIWTVRETKTQYLIYLNSLSAIILPKRYFKDAAEQSAWRALIEEKISPKTIEAPGFLARQF